MEKKISPSLDEQFMQRALELAALAKGYTSPNPMVGCVIVKNNKIIAEGCHLACGSDHAEVVALKKCGSKAKGATLYVNLEPCFHHGRTPPCVEAIIQAGISEVVVAMKDPNPLTNGKALRKLKEAGIRTLCGVLKESAEQLNEVFVKNMKEQMPFVVAKIAQTLDGKTANAHRESKWITSDKTREVTRNIRNEFDAILVGLNTIIKDDPQLNPSRKDKVLKKIVVDSKARLPLTSKFLADPVLCVVATTEKASEQHVTLLRHKGVEVIVCPVKNNRVDLKFLFKELARREIMSVLIEGGSEVIGSALKDGLVDKMQIYIAPKIMGDQKALSAVTGLSVSKMDEILQLRDVQVSYIHSDLKVEGYVLRNS